jgi:hypothetical protein
LRGKLASRAFYWKKCGIPLPLSISKTTVKRAEKIKSNNNKGAHKRKRGPSPKISRKSKN